MHIDEPMLPVVAGLNGSTDSLCAIDLAAEEALGRVTPLDVVYVYRRHDGPGGQAAGALSRAHDLLDAALERVRAEHPGLAVRGTFVTGEPDEVLLRHAASACLVVLGHTAAAGHELGPVTLRVVGRSPAPVIVCRQFDREHFGGRPRPVLVGVDPRGSDAPVAFAFAEAALRGAPLCAMHVVAPAAGGDARGESVVAAALGGWPAKYPQVDVRTEVVAGSDAAAAVIDASHDAQLVVVGRSAHPSLGEPFPGTVGWAVLEHAGCSVAIAADA